MTSNAERDQRVLQLFLAGATFGQIAAAASMTVAAVHKVVLRQLEASGSRREVLLAEARAVHMERTESLLKAHWTPALRGDHKSAEIVRKILDQQARQFDMAETPKAEGDVIDEIAARRAHRGAGPATRPARPKRSG